MTMREKDAGIRENEILRTHVAAGDGQVWWEEKEYRCDDDVCNAEQVAHPAERTR